METTNIDKRTATRNNKLHVAIAIDGRRQRDLALIIGMDETTLSQIKQGRYKPTAATKQSIADVLGTTVDQIFDPESDDAS